MKLIFDTETTGLAKFNLPLTHIEQPRIVSIAALLLNNNLDVVSQLSAIVYPLGFGIPDQAAAIHGIGTHTAIEYGLSGENVLMILANMLCMANEIIGHNLKFDWHMLQVEFYRLGIDSGYKVTTPHYCTMLNSTNICKIPSARGGYKWPKLSEVYRYAFGKEFEGAHNSLNDVLATLEVYKWLVRGAPLRGEKYTSSGVDMAKEGSDITVENNLGNSVSIIYTPSI